MTLDVTTFEPGDNFFFPRFFALSYSRFLSFLTKGENLEVKPFHHFFDEQAYDFDTFVIGLKTKVYPCDPHILWTQSGGLF